MSLPEEVLKLLGVEFEENFKMEEDSSLLYKIDSDFIIWKLNKDIRPTDWTESTYTIGDIFNGDFEIIKLPHFIESDLHLAKGYLANGYPYVARDKDGTVSAYMSEPDKDYSMWLCGKPQEYCMELPEQSFKSLTWHDKPLSLQTVIDEMEEK